MSHFLRDRAGRARSLFPVAALGAALAAVAWSPSGSQAQQAGAVVRVEEDWVLMLNEPNSSVNAPQFHTLMSPFPHLDGYYGQVTWNYRELPSFTAGGLQLQIWDGDNCLRRTDRESGVLSTSAETISWTQVLETNGIDLAFSVINGRSTTWGLFGGQRAYLNANVPDLAGYCTDVSQKNSWITYGSNRVTLLAIAKVRRYDALGNLVSTDTIPKVIFDINQ